MRNFPEGSSVAKVPSFPETEKSESPLSKTIISMDVTVGREARLVTVAEKLPSMSLVQLILDDAPVTSPPSDPA